ncbi:MAG: hypothetical protein CK429_08140 [Mycobacterium sp.]|nr:MAG: hypothetical protein CK428_19360 [Mycobacterium sp.]PJE17096.1 MAG: hypothetical protein CK429_08140 [Mycobacterium sp.]
MVPPRYIQRPGEPPDSRRAGAGFELTWLDMRTAIPGSSSCPTGPVGTGSGLGEPGICRSSKHYT